MQSREVIRRLKKAGWEHVRATGSHHDFRHPGRPGIVTVPRPKKGIPVSTLKSVEKQSGIRLG